MVLLQVNDPPADPVLTKLYPHRYWSISAKKTYCEQSLPPYVLISVIYCHGTSWNRYSLKN